MMDGGEIGLPTEKWDVQGAFSDYDVGGGSYMTARNGSYVIRYTSGTNYGTAEKVFDNQQTWIVGFAVAFPSNSTANWLLRIIDNATIQCGLYVTGATGDVQFRHGDGTVLATVISGISAAIWYHIVVKVTIDNSAGAYTIHLNGAEVASATSVDTQNSANATADRIYFSAPDRYTCWDDIYIFDGTGLVSNDIPGDGDLYIVSIMPTADTVDADWTPQGAGAHYVEVDEVPTPDGDTTYVSSNVATDLDIYDLGNLPEAAEIYGMQVYTDLRKEGVGARTCRALLKSAGTISNGASVVLGANYVGQLDVWDTDPATSVQWLDSAVDALQVGIEVVS